MKVTYTGTPEFPPVQRKKLETRMARLSKLLDRDGEKGLHVVLTTQRHMQRGEITVNLHDHPLVSHESNGDALTAILGAAEKMEKQILKLKAKWRDIKRTPNGRMLNEAPPAAAAKSVAKKKNAVTPAGGRVFKVDALRNHKPMTVEEAVLEMDGGGQYTVYRDAATDKISVLIRRKDGHFDLIES